MYEWFAESAARHPEAVALEVAGEEFTYRELAELSGRLAADIVAALDGRTPARVGLLAARSVTAYAGYLAVQRLGATVVPLNPTFPPARNDAIARAAALDAVVAEAGHECPAGPVIVTGPLGDECAPVRRPEQADISYILFTSGSTGAPKGVPIQHRNVDTYLRHVIARYGIAVGDRLSQTFDLTFDLSVFDLFAAWGAGATLVVPDRADLVAPARFVATRRITHWFSVPSVASFAMRLRGLTPGCMPDLRWSLFCGEPLTAAQAAAWQAAAPGSVLENLYGPTELTLSCSQFRYSADWRGSAGDSVPIGDLYPGVEALVIDDQGVPADIGELCVRGPQRFPGYLDPADNAGRFVRFDHGRAVVVGESAAEFWYRTGDRVRRSEDGLVHLGRLDQQVKVRGYRVELGEIEVALRSLPGVRDAVVVAVPGRRGETKLVATCTGRPADDLLAVLRTRLPEYMVPETLTVVDTLPLNANGKIDRRALVATN
jgi:amino acid adenylation domain-containing protein